MARSAEQTADILSTIFELHFGQDYAEPYRIKWPQLRSPAGVPKLTESFVKDISTSLSDLGEL